jgi:hypothetical protein
MVPHSDNEVIGIIAGKGAFTYNKVVESMKGSCRLFKPIAQKVLLNAQKNQVNDAGRTFN